jgi:pilus assembly protein CpaC
VPFLTGTEGIPLQPNVPLSLGFPRIQMQLFISALRQNSLLRILAEPNLVAISGQTANFLVGGEYAYPIPQEGGVPAVDFKEFGVRLAFTPTVLAGQRIRLRIMPEVSQPDDTIGTVIQGTAVPGKSTRQLETVVEVGNGQTLALAGLLNDQIRSVAQKIPGLGDVPVFGALFSSVRYQRNQTELLVLCTPELVAPMNPDQVPPVPGEEITTPNDWQLFGLGQVEGEKRPVPSAPERALKTAAPVRTYKQGAEGSGGVAQLSLHGPWGPAEGNEKF